MLDKSSENWHQAPWWVRTGLFAIARRKTAIAYEYTLALIGLLCALLSLFVTPVFCGISLLAFAGAYGYAISIRWADNHKLWREIP